MDDNRFTSFFLAAAAAIGLFIAGYWYGHGKGYSKCRVDDDLRLLDEGFMTYNQVLDYAKCEKARRESR